MGQALFQPEVGDKRCKFNQYSIAFAIDSWYFLGVATIHFGGITMSLGYTIAHYRKANNITQEQLAQQLGVTNQAVSKWESDQCCPDVMLLPKIADIFDISLDALFDRTPKKSVRALPWKNDGTLRIVLYIGHTLVGNGKSAAKDLTFTYEGEALNVESAITVNCGNVQGNVDAGVDINCGNVGGYADAGRDIHCGNVGGYADAGVNIVCGNVGNYVDAGCTVECGNVEGDIDAAGVVTIRK